jgi:pteridine reductase
MQVAQKVALVTGSAHRVGKAIALGLARAGCHVMVHYHHSRSAAEATVGEIRALGVRAEMAGANLRSAAGVRELFRQTARTFERLDILVNSAATLSRASLRKASEADWDAALELNLKGAFFCIQEAARRMDVQGGVIINIADIIGLRPWKAFPLHSIAKSALITLTQVAALELAPHIRVNAVAPGLILPPEGMAPERWQALGRATPLGRPGDPQDLVRAVLFLIHEDYITGETLVVDGGMQLRLEDAP